MRHCHDRTEVKHVNPGYVLTFYCHVTNDHKLGGCNTYSLALGSIGQKSGQGRAGFGTQDITRLKPRRWPGWVLTRKLWRKILLQAHSGSWPNFIPCSCRTEVCLSLLAVSQRLHSAPKCHPQFPAIWPPRLHRKQRIPHAPPTYQISSSGSLVSFRGLKRPRPARIILS